MDAIGPTGKFPDGKIDPGDNGEIIIGVGINSTSDHVIMQFGTMLQMLAMSSEQAIEIGNALINLGKKLQD